MDIDNAIRSGFSVLVSRPGGVLPLYLFGASTLLISRVPLFVGAALAFIVLVSAGRITPVIREFRELDIATISSPPVNPSRLQELADALAGLVTPVTIVITVVALLSFLVLFIVTRSVAAAGTLHAVYAAQTGRESLLAGINGIARDTRRFIGLWLVRGGLIVIVSLPLLYVLLTISGIGDVFLAIVLGVLWVLALVAIFIALLFAGPAIVIDDVGTLTAVRHSLGFIRSRIDVTIAYIGICIIVAIIAAIVLAITAFLSLSRIFVLFLVLAILPYLDTVKTGLYAEDAELETEMKSARSVGRRFVAVFRDGWIQIVRFITNHPITNLVSLGLFLLGIIIGWMAVSGFSVNLLPSADVRNIFGTVPIDVFVQIAANNWYVAVNEIFAGLAFAVPTITNLLFNGLIVGVVGGVTAPIAFAALVLPHGIIEIPGLALAGGVGLHLGRIGWKGVRGRITTEKVADEISQAYEILLGLACVFVIAAFIEVFITPWIASIVLTG